MMRVRLPHHLQQLARVGREITLEIEGTVTLRSALDALEAAHPSLRGTIRDSRSLERRALVRFFALETDLSHQAIDLPLPDAVARGDEPLLVIGAIAGG
ncbi:MAG: MoaD/ThiS family protein [Pleurocapsa sp. SU_196_0]|nr:MoaD/ThiS family protein [Pleurocapsa sp. SU_196_0]